MSGDSLRFRNLYRLATSALDYGDFPHLSTVEDMADYLDELGHPRAARRTREAAEALAQFNAVANELAEVWKAAEYCYTGDRGPASVQRAVDEWSDIEASLAPDSEGV